MMSPSTTAACFTGQSGGASTPAPTAAKLFAFFAVGFALRELFIFTFGFEEEFNVLFERAVSVVLGIVTVVGTADVVGRADVVGTAAGVVTMDVLVLVVSAICVG